MKLKCASLSELNKKTDVLVFPLHEGQRVLSGNSLKLDKSFQGAISRLLRQKSLSGKYEKLTPILGIPSQKPKTILAVGWGKPSRFSYASLREISGEIARKCKSLHAKRAVVVLPEKAAGFPAEKVGQCLAEGFLLGQYTFSKYKTSKKETETFVDQIEILEPIRSRWNALEEGFKKGIKIAEGVNLARDLANTPANDMTPSRFVETAKTLFKKGSSITLEILDREKVKQLGMGAFLGVAQGSNQEPYMLILRYLSETHEKPVCLVGKGVTFDSGGISIKPALNMSEMKADMSGAAAVLGTFLALDKLKWNVNVMGVIPLCENMLSGTAQRPGDIVRAMNGKTIEIINTDAEGRLILADALCYAVSKNVKEIVDIATLTGAAIVALGETAAAVLGNRKKSVDKILKQASFTDEKLWPLPLYEEYMELLKSDVADLINCSESRLAGTCSAAKFLEQFVNNTPWIHLDIAGMMSTKKTKGYGVKGMSGFGVRTLLQYLEAQLK